MTNHSLLSASSSHRWLHCPPSARLCEGYDDKGSNFAAEGTDAHALCEYKLRAALGMEAKDPTEDLSWYDAEMEESANGYAAFVMELVEEAKKNCSDLVVLIEQRLDYSRYVAEGFGTGDCVIIADDLTDMFSCSSKTPEIAPAPEKAMSLEEVRAILADKSRDGFTAQIRDLLQKYGASKLSEIDPANYKALVADAEVLGND